MSRLPSACLAPIGAALAWAVPAFGHAQALRPSLLEIEAVSVTQTRNTVQLPNDDTGTRFAIGTLTGNGPETGLRLTFTRALSPTQEFRLLYAPLSLSGTGTLDAATGFEGQTFAAGGATRADYRFNSYRATWRYSLLDSPAWSFKLGFTAKIRDARIALSQDGVASARSDLGFVPLAHFQLEHRLGERLALVGDFDGLAGGRGRAIDLGMRLRYDINDTLSISGGWRLLDGGVDSRDNYNFARFRSWTLGLGYRF